MSGLKEQKFLIENDNHHTDLSHNTGKSKIVMTIRKLVSDLETANQTIESISNQKNDTNNLKVSYKEFVEQYNVNSGVLNERLKAVEELLKKCVTKLNEIEDL